MNVVFYVIKKIWHLFIYIYNKSVLYFFNLSCRHYNKSNLDINRANSIIRKVYHPDNDLSPVERGDRKNQYDLSVVVPVYNGEKYLSQCIESILNQKTKYKFEVICVDDGSTDNSFKILNKYMNDGIHLTIIHQNNKGISGARNTGLKHALGKYILFIDNDDFIDSNFIDIMLDKAYVHKADIVKCGYKLYRKGKNINSVIEDDETYLYGKSISNIYKFNGFCWGMIISYDLFINIEFPEKYWYEDMLTRLMLYPQCKVFYYLSDALYNYRMHENNASSKVWSKNDYKSLDQLYLVEQMFDLSEILNFNFNAELCLAYQYEIGKMLYERTIGLSEEIKEAVFVFACSINDKLLDKCANYYMSGDISEKMLNKSFKNRDFNLWKKICKHI